MVVSSASGASPVPNPGAARRRSSAANTAALAALVEEDVESEVGSPDGSGSRRRLFASSASGSGSGGGSGGASRGASRGASSRGIGESVGDLNASGVTEAGGEKQAEDAKEVDDRGDSPEVQAPNAPDATSVTPSVVPPLTLRAPDARAPDARTGDARTGDAASVVAETLSAEALAALVPTYVETEEEFVCEAPTCSRLDLLKEPSDSVIIFRSLEVVMNAMSLGPDFLLE